MRGVGQLRGRGGRGREGGKGWLAGEKILGGEGGRENVVELLIPPFLPLVLPPVLTTLESKHTHVLGNY